MADLQLNITIGETEIKLQGEGELVYKIFQELREEGLGILQKIQSHHNTSKNPNFDETKEKEKDQTQNVQVLDKKTSKNKKKNSSKQPQLIKDLDLSGKNTAKSLKDFTEEKKPKSNIEKTTVYIYYLQNILQQDDITIDHVFTCYKNCGDKYPLNLQQNLNDTSSSRYGYIEIIGGKYKMSIAGINFVEHDLPKKE